MGNGVIDIRSFKGKVAPDAESVTIETGEIRQRLIFAYQKTGFGRKRYFLCPECARRAERLYFNGRLWKCQKCSGVNPYWGIQNTTKGGYDEIQYRMERFAYRNGIEFTYPFDYLNFLYDRRISNEKFRKKLKILQGLENMRFQSIFFNQQYRRRTINAVLSGNHPFIRSDAFTLKDLREHLYSW